MDKIYQEAVNSRIQHHSEEIGRIKEIGNRVPVWSDKKYLFDKKRGKTKFTPMGVPTGTIGVYRIIYEPTMETLSIGCGIVANRLSRHRLVFLNGGVDVPNPGGTTNGSATGGHMYKYDTHRKNWLFTWCSIGNKSLAEEVEDLLIKLERPPFNKEWMGGK
tara:strand:+ start:209 stop:691 length:483 start_codon:yes stop_codon:yes gene_type:complete